MDAVHVVWVLIFIILCLLFMDMIYDNAPRNKPRGTPRAMPTPMPPPTTRPSILRDERDWEREAKTNKSVRFTFSNDFCAAERDRRATPELDQMYVPARLEVPTDDPFACKAQPTALPFANPNPNCLDNK